MPKLEGIELGSLWERFLSQSTDLWERNMSLGARLKEERERLGMSQPTFAAIAGTTKQTLFSWESGKTAPDGFQIAAFAGAGVDVLYVLTGQRSQPAIAPLSDDAKALLDDYQHSSSEGKEIIRGVALQAAQAKKSKRRA